MSRLKVEKGERFRLRYTILIHEVNPKDFDPAKIAPLDPMIQPELVLRNSYSDSIRYR